MIRKSRYVGTMPKAKPKAKIAKDALTYIEINNLDEDENKFDLNSLKEEEKSPYDPTEG